jgi:hypothetical protein
MGDDRNRRRAWVIAGLAATFSLFVSAGAPAGLASGRAVETLPEQIINRLGPDGVDPSGRPIASGRVQDVEADPFEGSGQRLLALSESALWESTDGGRQWHHLSGLDQYGQWSFGTATLAFDPAQPGVVLIASTADDRQPTARGVYRSTDGGRTWSQPTSYQPACSGGGVGFPMVVTFFGRIAYAAAGCVVGKSSDDGATWSWTAPDLGGNFYGVAVDPVGNVFACGSDGIYEQSATRVWRRVIDFSVFPWMLGRPGDTCRMTAIAREHIFFTALWSGLGLDPNNPGVAFSAVVEAYAGQGWQWQDLKAPAHVNGRDVVVETRPDPKTFSFDLYWNSTDLWYYQRCTGTGFFCTPGVTNRESGCPPGDYVPDPPWIRLDYCDAPALHADAGRILFWPEAPFCIRLIADDGGIQVPGPDDCDGTRPGWSYSNAGIQALQPKDVAVTSIVGTTTSDVYAAAQDNGGYALLPGEHGGWRQVDGGNDGLAIGATASLTASTLSSGRVFYNGDGAQHSAHRGFDDFGDATGTPFQSPWSGLINPQQLAQLPDGRLVIAVCPGSADRCTAPQAALFTSTGGSSWTRLDGASLRLNGRTGGEGGVSVIATGTAAAPVMFVRALGSLFRVDRGLSSRTLLPLGTDVGAYAAGDESHLLVFSCPSTTAFRPGGCRFGTVEASDDGGKTWRSLDVITRLVASDGFGGTYPADTGDALSGEIMSVAVSPTDTSILAVGTRDTGLFDSSDGGRSWERLPFLAPNLLHLRFSVDGRLFIGSYGRGLFVLWPTPDQLRLDLQLASPGILRYSFWAQSYLPRGRAGPGRPIQGLRLDFTLLAPDGTGTSLGTRTTNAAGRGYVTLNYPLSAGYTLVAHWSGPGNAELETQAPVPAARSIHP